MERPSAIEWEQTRKSLVSIIDDYNHAISKLAALTSDLPRRLCIRPMTVECTMGLHPEGDIMSREQTNDRVPNPRVSPRHVARPIVSSAFENGHGLFEADDDVMRPVVVGVQHTQLELPSQQPSIDDLSTDELYTRSFEMLQEWVLKDSRTIEQHIKAANGSAERDKTFARTVSITNRDGKLQVSSLSKRIVGSPDSHFRVAWELFGILLALYDMIWVPLILAFDPPEGIRKYVDWTGRCFWTLNVPMTLTSGYVDDGKLIMDLKLIFCLYLKTWFVIDVFTIPPDWLFLFIGSGGNSPAYVKILRSLRTLRLFRLARLVKLRDAWTFIFDSIDSEQVGIFLEVVKMVLVLMLVNHYNACLWCLMGKTNDRNNWIEKFGYDSDTVEWQVQYVVAYHWSITQFTPSSMHVQPMNPGERVFAIVVVIFGLVGFSYLVGSITSSLGRLRAISELKTTSFWHLRKFMRRYGVPYQLSTRIKSYVENRWADSHNNMRLANMEFLDMLSENLKGELALELHGRALCIHPLLDHLSLACAGTLQRVAIHGVGQLCLAPQDVMFHAGEEATHMSLVASGSMHYTRVHQEQSYPEPVNSHEDWITEPALWVADWRHLGDLRSTETTELLMVSSDKLAESASMNPLALWTVHHYAHRYTAWLNATDPSRLSDITQGEERSQELYTFVRHYDYSGDSGNADCMRGVNSHFSKQSSVKTNNTAHGSAPESKEEGGNSVKGAEIPNQDKSKNSVKDSVLESQEKDGSHAKNQNFVDIDHMNILTSDNIALEFDENVKIRPI